jgi:uncharacterized membrane protein YphA (DoxX/SURF4 family)
MSFKNVLSWLLRITAAIILLQTLYFKFTAQPESVELFTKLGVEPWGRIGTGILELFASILLILPSTVFLGAIFGMSLMSGAILAHLTVIGIQSQNDGGQLFTLAITVFLCCLVIMFLHKKQGIDLYNRYIKKKI